LVISRSIGLDRNPWIDVVMFGSDLLRDAAIV
jgi:hypothetical protein